ncbi:MAG TPA: sigma-54 dependent transcriptional regulator, partial [Sphingomonas sp.]|nr:sigma-54 dependent transcriptional regulator [Sphingomonas sp.]
MAVVSCNLVRVVLVGRRGSEFLCAAELAHQSGAEVVLANSPAAALDSLRRHSADLVMIDVQLDVPAFLRQLRSERLALPVLACGVHASAERAVAAIRAGAIDYVPLPPQRELIAAAILAAGQRVSSPIGEDPALTLAIEYARAVAPAGTPMLISGEPGTGKQVMARLIHTNSGRAGRFVTIECEGVAPEILESELFGHEAGAFPGAVEPRIGRLEDGASGTVFLREVGALPASVQARLAAWLRDGEAPVAPAAPLRARIVASSSRDLGALSAAGMFRADLLARLCLVRIDMPPLRERGEDIASLATHFAERLAMDNALPVRPFAKEAMRCLRSHTWPGNVRELEDVVHRAILLARGPAIEADALVFSNGSRIAATEACAAQGGSQLQVAPLVGHSMAEIERELILHTLNRCGGNRTTASTILGISVRTMRNKLKSFIDAGIP